MNIKNHIYNILYDKSGSVPVLFALSLVSILGVCSFALDASQMYLMRRRAQVLSDAAVLAAASTSPALVGSKPSPRAVATAVSIARLNGLDPDRMALTADTSPANPGVMALKSDLSIVVPLPLGFLSTSRTSIVHATSWAEIQGAGACLRSQLGPTNIYGSAVVTGSACLAEANTYLYACGTSQTSIANIRVGYSAQSEKPYVCPTAAISPGPGAFQYETAATDTIASSAPVSTLKSHLDTMAQGWPYATRSPVSPKVLSGPDQTYANGVATVPPSERIGALTMSNASVTFAGSGGPDTTCQVPTTVAATVTLMGTNKITLKSGCYVFQAAFNANSGSVTTFDTAPGSSVTLVFNGTMTVLSAAALSFGPARVFFNGGSITNQNGSSLSFGGGSFELWGGTIYNTASSSTLSLGNGPFLFYGGSISNTGRMTLGNGPFWFQGGSLAMNAGSQTSFGIGPMDFYGGSVAAGGSQVVFGAGGSSIDGAGAVSMAGGSFALTADTLTARGVSFGFRGGTLSLTGVGTIAATAPTGATPTYGYRNLLFGIWGGAFSLYQSKGQQDLMSGLIYVPTSNASIYGSQTITYPAGGCFSIISGVLDIYQNAQLSVAPCAGFPGTSPSVGKLVR